MSIIIDLIIIAIVIVSAILGSKRGFVRVVIELAGFVVILLVAVWASNNLSEPIYQNNLKPGIEEKIEQSLDVSYDVSSFYSSLPSYITFALQTQGVTQQSLQQYVDKEVSNGVTSLAPVISDYIIKPIVTAVISAVLMFAIFFIGMFVIKLIAKWINTLVKKTPLVGKVNTSLGSVVGALKGIVISMALVWIIGTLVSFVPSGDLGITETAFSNSYLCGLLNSLNPLI